MEQTKTKKALIMSVLSVFLCIAMLIGMTFAWFTDTASTGVNKIQAGNLKVGLEYKDNDGKWQDATKTTLQFKVNGQIPAESTQILWEPGCRYELPELRVVNKGNLALKYKVVVTGATGDMELLDVIQFSALLNGNKTAQVSNGSTIVEGNLDNENDSLNFTIRGTMDQSAGNKYQGKSISGIAITVYATQDTVENDSFGNTYDENAGYPVTSYSNLKSALAKGGNISINDAITADNTKTTIADRITITKPTTLSLGAIYTVPGELEASNNWAALYISADTTINASKNGGINCVDKTDPNASYIGGTYVAHITGGTVTVNGGKYYAGGTVFNVQQGTLIVNGGFFEVTPDIDTKDSRYLLNCIDNNYKNGTAKIIVKGGTFVNFDPSNNAAEGAGTNFVADGYKVVSETKGNDTYYTVVKE